MKKQNLNRLMASLFLVFCITFIINEVRQKPRIFILHSYGEDYTWTQEVTEGINRVLRSKPYSIQWHYMDTKRHPSEAFKRRATKTAQEVIEQWQPNVVIAIADNAQQAMEPYINHPDISIVFAGVIEDPSVYGYDETALNVAGIQEHWPMTVIKDSLNTVFDNQGNNRPLLNLIHIGDDSTTGTLIEDEILAFEWGRNLSISSISVSTMSQWEDAILLANSEADVVIFSLYHTLRRHDDIQPDGSGETIPPDEVMAWTMENLKKPGVGGWGFYVEQGGMMAIGVSAYEQGEESARLASVIIDDNVLPSMLPYQQSKQFLIHLREPLLKKYNVEVPRIYEAFARANNNYHL